MSRPRHRREQWQHLINEFEQSGLSQTAFCKTHDINPKYFSLKRSRLKAASENPPASFVRINPSPTAFVQTGIIVQCGRVRITLPEHIATGTLSDLVKALV